MSDYLHGGEPDSRRSRLLLGIGSGLTMIATACIGLVLLVLVNGGLAYRKDCATQRGTVSKSWTYQWNAPIPYLLAPSEEGCQVHNGTRVLLSSIGLWPLAKASAGSIAQSTAKDPGTAYYATIYGVMSEILRPKSKRTGDAFVTLLEDSRTTLAAQTPPDYLAAEADKLMASFDRMVVDGKKARTSLFYGNQRAYRDAYDKFLADTQAFLKSADTIRQAVIKHRGG